MSPQHSWVEDHWNGGRRCYNCYQREGQHRTICMNNPEWQA